MKRFHVHVAVKDLASSVRFYSALFGADPTVQKSDYAKWMVDDPRINFAISQRGDDRFGINHLGLQVDSDAELETLRTQAEQADVAAFAEKGSSCCYARSDKYWYTDPQGVAWETYHTLNQIEYFGGDEEPKQAQPNSESTCCDLQR
ncbi:MAG: ArsI/CadI family heavy metal resistance metalloenzyme [Burkholderiaceae bacterium]